MPGKCEHPECDRVGKLTKGLCRRHYMRLWRNGDASTVKPPGITGDGRRAHPLYGSWAAMVNRCHNPNNSSYQRYGARGIHVCDRWRHDFMAFLGDMGERPEGKTLDRIDPYGPYSPDNCRWATLKEQRANMTDEGRRRMAEGARRSRLAYWSAKKPVGA